jgi:hypothetical protein
LALLVTVSQGNGRDKKEEGSMSFVSRACSTLCCKLEPIEGALAPRIRLSDGSPSGRTASLTLSLTLVPCGLPRALSDSDDEVSEWVLVPFCQHRRVMTVVDPALVGRGLVC